MSQAPAQLSEIRRKEYRARAIQFLAGLKFPATKDQILAHYTRRNTPMELVEDTLTLPSGTFDTPAAFADAIITTHLKRQPHTWTSREIRD
jgi:hypothetical protein